ncbi:conserved unknown protein [Ectocarpus siliculosus]|uniref:RRM domain-containing protein n=1 Tax=Ectocarpus siliculosus TaxID=2880 RepID=D8LIQ1_ECTSI|nr:conserved unknown protein [Ectocarpus siliculosus]|eukprot:CBN75961.1 conserved unknown protein [Ectocarpus siliculosus]
MCFNLRDFRQSRSPPRRRERSRSRSRDRGGGGRDHGREEEPAGTESTCGKDCGDECDNNRVYVSGLPTTITETDLVEKFSTIGIIARIRQKRGYKDQWPFSVRIYKDDNTGKPKGDCIIKYEEPNSAHAALRWFDGIDFKGGKIGVAMAAKPSLNNRY